MWETGSIFFPLGVLSIWACLSGANALYQVLSGEVDWWSSRRPISLVRRLMGGSPSFKYLVFEKQNVTCHVYPVSWFSSVMIMTSFWFFINVALKSKSIGPKLSWSFNSKCWIFATKSQNNVSNNHPKGISKGAFHYKTRGFGLRG